jgi:hypothetical protein
LHIVIPITKSLENKIEKVGGVTKTITLAPKDFDGCRVKMLKFRVPRVFFLLT